jgi:hypothetical protein
MTLKIKDLKLKVIETIVVSPSPIKLFMVIRLIGDIWVTSILCGLGYCLLIGIIGVFN